MEDKQAQFVQWFRAASPYINAHRGRTFVIGFGGEAVADASFPHLIHDIALLNTLGVRLVLAYGTRPQIERELQEQGAEIHYVNGLRITDKQALACVKEAVGAVRIEIEALLSMGLANSPMAGARIRVASGNFVTAKPVGIREGIDFAHTGEVRRIDTEAINERLGQGEIVLIPPVGYSTTGEVFNLDAQDVATAVASELRASKLIFLLEEGPLLAANGVPVRQLTQRQAQQLLAHAKKQGHDLFELECAIDACKNGVPRVHLIDRHTDGALLLELFSRDGIGAMVSAAPFDHIRKASIDDVAGLLELIAPLEAQGILVRRSREKLEMEIGYFTLLIRDGAIIGCAALYPYQDEGVAELACLAVDADYRNAGRGEELLTNLEEEARQRGLQRLLVLTTQTAHWFLERGFVEAKVGDLPVARKNLYNFQRKSKVFIKEL
jgi:amino-acid N-acetyltransferase